MKYENYQKVKELSEKIIKLESMLSDLSEVKTISLETSTGYSVLNLPVDVSKQSNGMLAEATTEFHYRVINIIETDIERIKTELEKL